MESRPLPILESVEALDQQVASTENLAAIRVALAGNADATVKELPGLNHMFQTATTGALGEYADIAETFSPKAMDTIASWILKRFGPAGLLTRHPIFQQLEAAR